MTHALRPLERLRRLVASVLHLPLSLVGLYAERNTPNEQYAVTVHEPYRLLEARLHRLGFVRNLVSSLKYRSYETDPETTVASWARYPDGALASDQQLHIGLFVGSDRETTDMYAHWEPSWIRHPVRHYRAEDVDAEEGIRRLRELFEREGIVYAVRPPSDRMG
ncbi:hypothetical protein [Halorubrum cibi]|uniref:Uncharacterized protein n=1 Tax=Halorubrum cibi TaxID=413815 RepID=A0A521D093_9EURY|nr:hypothetical protein [Halorubrum cibi]SMO65109.1 hypothetical protein SAMN06264867_105251 [Halorubrum cibi]